MTSCLICNQNRIFKQVVKNNFCVAKQIYNVFSLSLITLKVLTKKLRIDQDWGQASAKVSTQYFSAFNIIASWYRLIETKTSGQDCQHVSRLLRFSETFGDFLTVLVMSLDQHLAIPKLTLSRVLVKIKTLYQESLRLSLSIFLLLIPDITKVSISIWIGNNCWYLHAYFF